MLLKSLEVGQARKEGRKKPRFIYSGSSLSVIFPPAKIDQFAFVVDENSSPLPRFLILFRNFRLWCTFPLSLFFSVFFLSVAPFLFFFRKGRGWKKKRLETISKLFQDHRSAPHVNPPTSLPQVLFVSSTRAIDPASLSVWFTKRNDNAILIVPEAQI